ncbi:DUF4219 domain-containing protein/UBN2 domain-containing protein [Cephalotus follicularis]|uniref:DUF4219 domain-containing protein/UBN2 domain-containing protein n=1 Tax=Cephalotus follicularis TaxID=3775 RepID=A0A1Q3CJA2_CEPFO|nr:DUF4219 domain-containing protein/UBN2 domain-containing protein [Cephalotus follicularis]
MALSSHVSLPPPTVFGGDEYEFWAVKMEAYLKAYNLWSAVEKGYEPLAESGNLTVAQIKQLKEESRRNYKALSFLHSAVAATIFQRIVGASTEKEAWDTLQEEFQGSDRVRAIKLLNFRRECELLKMKDGNAIKDYVSKLIETINQMRIVGEKIPDQKIIEKVLISLPERFDSKVAAIEESKDLAKLIVNELIRSLQAHEQRICKRVESSTEGAFQARFKGKQPSSSREVKKQSGYDKNIKTKGGVNETEGEK